MSDRAVSSVLGYVLTLAITTLLIAGLLVASGGFVEGQRDRVVHSELEVVGERLATDLEHADRMGATLGDEGTARVDVSLPRRVAGVGYAIDLTAMAEDDHYRITASTTGQTTDVETSTTVRLTVELDTTTVRGGDLRIVFTPGSDPDAHWDDDLEVTTDD